MFYFQFIVPPGHPKYEVPYDIEMIATCISLKKVDRESVPFPNSTLSVKLTNMLDGASVEIRKRDKMAFINILCFEAGNLNQVFATVEKLYLNYKLGQPKRPTMESWIHSIPVPGPSLRENEILLSQKITLSFFWHRFAHFINKRNPYN
jgi:hypothetical protein